MNNSPIGPNTYSSVYKYAISTGVVAMKKRESEMAKEVR